MREAIKYSFKYSNETSVYSETFDKGFVSIAHVVQKL